MLHELKPSGAAIDYMELFKRYGLDIVTKPDPISIDSHGLNKSLEEMSVSERFESYLVKPGPRGEPRVVIELGIGRGYGTVATVGGYREKGYDVKVIGVDNGSSDEYKDEAGEFRLWRPDKLTLETLSHFKISFQPDVGQLDVIFANGTGRQTLDYVEGINGVVHDIISRDPPERGFGETGYKAQQYGNRQFVLHAGRVLPPSGRLITLGTGKTDLEKLMVSPYKDIMELFEDPETHPGFYRQYDLPNNQISGYLIRRLINEALIGETRLNQEDIAALTLKVQGHLPDGDKWKINESIRKIIQRIEESSEALRRFRASLNNESVKREVYSLLTILKRKK